MHPEQGSRLPAHAKGPQVAAWVCLGALLLIGLLRLPAFLAFNNPDRYLVGFDFFLCNTSARALQEGLPDIYGARMAEYMGQMSGGRHHFPDNHPPPFYLMFVPGLSLGFWRAYRIHNALSVVLLGVALGWLARWLGAERLPEMDGESPTLSGWHTAAIVALLLGGLVLSGVGIEHLYLGQVDFHAALCLVGLLVCVEQGYEEIGGCCLALAILIKGFPGYLGLWLLARRKVRALLACAVSFVGWLALGVVVWGDSNLRAFVDHTLHASYFVMLVNQSFLGWVVQWIPRSVPLATLKAFNTALSLGLGTVLVLQAPLPAPRGRVAAALEFSGYLMAAMICAPFSWPHHHILVAIPFTTLVLAALRPQGTGLPPTTLRPTALTPTALVGSLAALGSYFVVEGELVARCWPWMEAYLRVGGGLFAMLGLMALFVYLRRCLLAVAAPGGREEQVAVVSQKA